MDFAFLALGNSKRPPELCHQKRSLTPTDSGVSAASQPRLIKFQTETLPSPGRPARLTRNTWVGPTHGMHFALNSSFWWCFQGLSHSSLHLHGKGSVLTSLRPWHLVRTVGISKTADSQCLHCAQAQALSLWAWTYHALSVSQLDHFHLRHIPRAISVGPQGQGMQPDVECLSSLALSTISLLVPLYKPMMHEFSLDSQLHVVDPTIFIHSCSSPLVVLASILPMHCLRKNPKHVHLSLHPQAFYSILLPT